jgi:hypothetical protein
MAKPDTPSDGNALNRNAPCTLCEDNSFTDAVEPTRENDDLRGLREALAPAAPSRFQRRQQPTQARH